ncbi:hypothetical protein SUGI_0987660 [Cryptomeria japonica]|nr:hypothetical protein SUGI_0987660 [Cryptomeria japonica]
MEKKWSLRQHSNPRWSGLGAIVREETGDTLKAFSGPVGIVTNNMAEISALEVGLKWCAINRIDKLIIEGDSQVILNGISSSKFQNWLLDNWTLRIKTFLNLIGDFHIQHKYREGNKAVDMLADLEVEESIVREFDSNDDLPKAVWNIISQERDRSPGRELEENKLSATSVEIGLNALG